MKSNSKLTPVHYIIWRIGIGGIELSLNHFVNEYTSRRDLTIYGLRATENEIYDESQVRVILGGLQKGSAYINYFNYCRAHRKDYFHLLNTGPIILLLTLLAGARKPLYHIRGTIYWDNIIQKIYLKLAWFLSWFLASMVGEIHFVGNSEHGIRIFRNKILPVKPELIYNGVEVNTFLNKRHQRKQLKRMAYIGRLFPGKNVSSVIRLFNTIAEHNPVIELHLAGDGKLRPELEAQARKSPFGDRIIFHGEISDIASFYASVDLFVFLSEYESFGNVLAEALLTGLPILTSNISVFEEIHGGDKAFVLGDPKDYHSMEKKFTGIIHRFPELAEKAYKLSDAVGEKFSIEKHLFAIEEIYNKNAKIGDKEATVMHS